MHMVWLARIVCRSITQDVVSEDNMHENSTNVNITYTVPDPSGGGSSPPLQAACIVLP